MAKATIASPNPSIFTSDPVEQIYAKGVLDRDMSGLSGLLLLSAQDKRAQDEDKYLGSLSESNRMSSKLAQMQEQFEFNKERMKQGVELLKEGFSASGLQGLETLIGDYKDADAMATLQRDLIRSQINRNNRPPGAGSGGVKDQITFEVDPLTGKLTPKIVTRGGSLEDQFNRGTGAYGGGTKDYPVNDSVNALERRRQETQKQLKEGYKKDVPRGQQ